MSQYQFSGTGLSGFRKRPPIPAGRPVEDLQSIKGSHTNRTKTSTRRIQVTRVELLCKCTSVRACPLLSSSVIPHIIIMENQASTSSGDIDQRRRDALIGYRNVSTTKYHENRC